MDRQDYRAATKRRHRATMKDLAPKLNAALDASPLDQEQRRTQFSVCVAQNVIKDALAVVAQVSIPFTLEWVVEMGARLAVYALTLAPQDDRQVLLAAMLKAIPEKLEQYEASGFSAAKTDWESF